MATSAWDALSPERQRAILSDVMEFRPLPSMIDMLRPSAPAKNIWFVPFRVSRRTRIKLWVHDFWWHTIMRRPREVTIGYYGIDWAIDEPDDRIDSRAWTGLSH